MTFLGDANRIASELRKRRIKKNPALGKAVAVKSESGGPMLTTTEAARLLNRKEQTLRMWSCMGNGPISPVRICGRLAWRVSDVEALLNGTGE